MKKQKQFYVVRNANEVNTKFTSAGQANTATYAIQHSSMAASCHFASIHGLPLTESTIRDKNQEIEKWTKVY